MMRTRYHQKVIFGEIGTSDVYHLSHRRQEESKLNSLLRWSLREDAASRRIEETELTPYTPLSLCHDNMQVLYTDCSEQKDNRLTDAKRTTLLTSSHTPECVCLLTLIMRIKKA